MSIDPLAPTSARPGSDEKINVLAARYAAGKPLWHPDDELSHRADGETTRDECDIWSLYPASVSPAFVQLLLPAAVR